jgi:hypothetical protein
MPGMSRDSLRRDVKIRSMLLTFEPEDGDIIIIGSANDKLTAELAAKNAALITVIDNTRSIHLV